METSSRRRTATRTPTCCVACAAKPSRWTCRSWIFEATSQRELAEIFTPAGQVAKVVFERACNFLRHGVVPVGVLDGVPPPEKLRRLGLLTAAGAGGGEFKKLGEVARKVLAALGLCAVVAPGEERRRRRARR